MPDCTINTEVNHARAFGAHVFAAGHGERYAAREVIRMRVNTCSIVLVLSGTLLANCYAEQKSSIPVAVQAAIEASDVCYHWAEENADQAPERNQDITEGVARDCPDAKKKAIEARKLHPSNPYLSLALLKLNDIGYFDLSEEDKEKVCEQGAPLLKNGFYESIRQDDYFKAFCPQNTGK